MDITPVELQEGLKETVSEDAELGEIRRKLNDYMERHRMSVTGLSKRIAKQTGKSIAEMGNNDVMRFLAGRNHAENDLAALLRKFLEESAAQDPLIAFGDALAEFQQCVSDENMLASVAGEYDVTGHVTVPWPRKDMQSEIHYSRIVFEAVSGLPYLLAFERLRDTSVSAARRGAGHEHEFEGVALIQAPCLTVMLRDVLTRRPKSYSLDPGTKENAGKFTGVVSASAFDGRTGAGGVVLDVSLEKIEAN